MCDIQSLTAVESVEHAHLGHTNRQLDHVYDDCNLSIHKPVAVLTKPRQLSPKTKDRRLILQPHDVSHLIPVFGNHSDDSMATEHVVV